MHGLSMVVGALVKTAYDGFCKDRDEKEKAAKVEVQPEPVRVSEAYVVGHTFPSIDEILDPDWQSKPRFKSQVSNMRVR